MTKAISLSCLGRQMDKATAAVLIWFFVESLTGSYITTHLNGGGIDNYVSYVSFVVALYFSSSLICLFIAIRGCEKDGNFKNIALPMVVFSCLLMSTVIHGAKLSPLIDFMPFIPDGITFNEAHKLALHHESGFWVSTSETIRFIICGFVFYPYIKSIKQERRPPVAKLDNKDVS